MKDHKLNFHKIMGSVTRLFIRAVIYKIVVACLTYMVGNICSHVTFAKFRLKKAKKESFQIGKLMQNLMEIDVKINQNIHLDNNQFWALSSVVPSKSTHFPIQFSFHTPLTTSIILFPDCCLPKFLISTTNQSGNRDLSTTFYCFHYHLVPLRNAEQCLQATVLILPS